MQNEFAKYSKCSNLKTNKHWSALASLHRDMLLSYCSNKGAGLPSEYLYQTPAAKNLHSNFPKPNASLLYSFA